MVLTSPTTVCGLLLIFAILLWPGARSLTLWPGPSGEDLRTPSRSDPCGDGSEATDPPRWSPGSATPDAVADALVLLALALRAGGDPVEALETVARHLQGPVARQLSTVAAAHRWGLEPDACWGLVPNVWHPAAIAWQAALRAGVSPSALLLRSASVIRDREAQRVEAALSRAGVLLVLPLGLAFLPGFIATTVVPVVLRLVDGFLAGGAVP